MLLSRFGLPSATSTTPALPTARWMMSWFRFMATAGVTDQPRPTFSSTAAAAPGWPSICPKAARSARRPKMIAIARNARTKPRMPAKIGWPIRKPIARRTPKVTIPTPATTRVTFGSTRLVIL
ncbi:hypothetical protein SANTM175S_02813 [Streptomyces antimycoticus]